MMDNSTTFQGDGKVAYIPVVVNGKQAKSKCFSCKNKNVKTSYGYTTCNYSGSECRNFELYDPIKKTNGDNVRAMTDEELAILLTDVAKKSAEKLCESLKTVDVDLRNCDFDILYKAHLDWLKQAAEEGES